MKTNPFKAKASKPLGLLKPLAALSYTIMLEKNKAQQAAMVLSCLKT